MQTILSIFLVIILLPIVVAIFPLAFALVIYTLIWIFNFFKVCLQAFGNSFFNIWQWFLKRNNWVKFGLVYFFIAFTQVLFPYNLLIIPAVLIALTRSSQSIER